MDKISRHTSPHRRTPTPDQWERQWQEHWSKVGQPGYELPVGGRGGDDREFLATARTPAKERARLERIYFFTRKVCLVKYSCAFIVVPGGLGHLESNLPKMGDVIEL